MTLLNHEEEKKKKLLWRGQTYTPAKKKQGPLVDHHPFTSSMNTFQGMELGMDKTSPKATMRGPHKSH